VEKPRTSAQYQLAIHTSGLLEPLAEKIVDSLLVFSIHAWRYALQTIMLACSAPLADRLAGKMLERLATMPRARETLRGAGNLVSEANLLQALEPDAGGQSTWLCRVVCFALRRLPWSDLLADWATQTEAADEQKILAGRISDRLREMTAPSRWLLILALVGHRLRSSESGYGLRRDEYALKLILGNAEQADKSR
jgi:hypothetical protein